MVILTCPKLVVSSELRHETITFTKILCGLLEVFYIMYVLYLHEYKLPVLKTCT